MASQSSVKVSAGLTRAQSSPGRLRFIFLLALAVHLIPLGLALVEPARAFTAGDSSDWDLLARNLVLHRVYSRSEEPPFEPEIFRAPGYPVFVAGLYRLTNFSLGAVLVVQAVLATAATTLVYRLGVKLGLAEPAALLGALVSLALPISTVFWATLASENLFVLFMLAAFVLAWMPAERQRWYRWLGAGLSSGLMVLSRPIGVLLLPAVAIGLVWRAGEGRRAWLPFVKNTLVRLAVAALGLSLVLSPWWVRNTRLFGRPVISTVGSVNLLTYNVAAVLARREGLGFWEGRNVMWAYWDAYYAALDPKPANAVEDAATMRQAAMEIILASPLEFAWVNTLESLNGLRPGVAQLSVFLQPGAFDETSGTEGDISPVSGALSQPLTRALTIALTGFYGLVFLLAGLGVVAVVARRQWPVLLGVALPIAILMLSPGPVSNSRFRVPAEPLIALLVAGGISYGLQFWQSVRRKSTAPTFAVPNQSK